MDGNFQKAAVAVFVAMVMDGLDGRVARLTNTQTPFGAEYDSLSDMISFGLAPALVVYEWALNSAGKLGWLAAFFFAVCAAFRLARYNTRIGLADKRFFEGLPSPSGAAIVASMVWLCTKYDFGGPVVFLAAFLVTAAAGALMVSTFPFYSGKDFNLGERIPFTYLLAIPAVFMLISLDPPLVFFSLFFLYALSGPTLSLYRWMRRRRRRAEREERDDTDQSKAA
jgi:CDP-diacylglycerol--serine O-phosphatidyltransferase